MGYTGAAMDEAVGDFLRAFSVGYPLLWALLVMAAVAASGLALHFLWQLILRVLGRAFGSAGGGKQPNGGGH